MRKAEAPGPTRECRRCRAELPTSEFYKCKHRADGLSVKCKACYYLRSERESENERVTGGHRERRCTRCNAWKPLDIAHYHRRHAARLGYNTRCIECYRETRHLGPKMPPKVLPHKTSRFECTHCCDLPWRDCDRCQRVAIAEQLPRADGHERRGHALEFET